MINGSKSCRAGLQMGVPVVAETNLTKGVNTRLVGQDKVDEARLESERVAYDEVMGKIIPDHRCEAEAHPRAIDEHCKD